MQIMNAMHGTMEPTMSHENMTHDMGHGGDMDHGDMDHGGMHSMYFSFTLPVQVLFYEWNITNQGQLAGSCIGVFILALLYEGLKVWRQYLLKCSKEKKTDKKLQQETKSVWKRMFNAWHILQSLLQIVQTTVGMFLMLIYMSFNVWLAISVSLGSGMGYFVFAWILPSDPEFGDHCQ